MTHMLHTPAPKSKAHKQRVSVARATSLNEVDHEGQPDLDIEEHKISNERRTSRAGGFSAEEMRNAISRRSMQLGVDAGDHPNRNQLLLNDKKDSEKDVNPKMDRRKECIIITFIIFAIIDLVAFILTVVIICMAFKYRLQYYVRRGRFAKVVFDFVSVTTKIMIGSMLHFISAIYGIMVLKGSSSTESIVLRFKERFLSWLLAVAIIGEVSLVSGCVDYFASDPIVANGIMAETLLPPLPDDVNDRMCFAQTAQFRRKPDHLTHFVFVNLKWMLEVICFNKSRDGTRQRIIDPTVVLTPGCEEHVKKYLQYESDDCELAEFLYGSQFVYLALAVIGLVFCAILCFIYFRAEIKKGPARFSISRPMEVLELKDFEMKFKGVGSTPPSPNRKRSDVKLQGTNAQSNRVGGQQLFRPKRSGSTNSINARRSRSSTSDKRKGALPEKLSNSNRGKNNMKAIRMKT